MAKQSVTRDPHDTNAESLEHLAFLAEKLEAIVCALDAAEPGVLASLRTAPRRRVRGGADRSTAARPL
jgi:hypothetical protein